MTYILSIDQGTTSSRALIFKQRGDVVSLHQVAYPSLFPQPGWVEQDPRAIWQSTHDAILGALQQANLTAQQISCIGIANQRETTIIWDRQTGESVYPAIVWQDRRTALQCEQLKQQGHESWVQQQTGLLLDPYFSASKIAWVLTHVPGVRKRAEKGELAFGTIDTYLVWQLSGGQYHITDASNAARTLLFDIKQQTWRDDLLQLFNIPASLLPKVVDNAGELAVANIFEHEIKITGMAGDQQAALVGQSCLSPGMTKSTYGTGCFVMQHTGNEMVKSTQRLLSTVAYRLLDNTQYALEGSIFAAASSVNWLQDNLGIINKASDTEKLAQQVSDTGGVYFIPAFTGLGAPIWRPDARAAILGLSFHSKAAHIVRACLEGICYQTRDLVEAMAQDSGQKISTLRVDGGMTVNNWLMQFLADMINAEVTRPALTETTALGAALLAGLGAGIYADLKDVAQVWQGQACFVSNMAENDRSRLYQGWQDALAQILNKKD